MTRDQTLSILRTHWAQLREQFGVRSLSIFGSVARNEATEASDVDLLAEFDCPTGFFELERLQHYLQDLLGCKVDVSTPDSLRKRIRQEVAREAIRVR
jgi:predicted nucleotidyltransferase